MMHGQGDALVRAYHTAKQAPVSPKAPPGAPTSAAPENPFAQIEQTMKNPVHPGEILREAVLADLGLSVGEAASRLGISRVTLSRVLHGHARISPNLAVRLDEAGVGTARAWLAMQSAHDLAAEHAAGVPNVRKLDHVA
jgi:addiction module HigA family antidote